MAPSLASSRSLSLLLAVLFSFLGLARARVAAAGTAVRADFPKLTAMDGQKLERLLEALKTRNQADRDAREAEIVKLGRGVVPAVVQKAHEKHKLQEAHLASILDKLLGKDDVAFVKGLLADPAPAVRVFAVRKLLSVTPTKADGDPELIELFKQSLNDADPEVKLAAALALADQHRADGLLVLIEALRSADKVKQEAVGQALHKLKGREAHKLVEGELSEKVKDADRRILVLKAIGMIGDPSAASLIGKSLEESNSRIQEAAVNALRGAVDGQPPVELATVFDLVKEIEAWKKRLGAK